MAGREYKTRHPLYKRWSNMIRRCSNPKYFQFHLYGGRGIKVCDRWQNFELFVEDMMPSFKTGLYLDRIDNDGNYEPSNCRWVSNKENCRNTSQNVRYYFKGSNLTLGEWAEKTGVKRQTLSQRIHAYKWSLDRALMTPTYGKRG